MLIFLFEILSFAILILYLFFINQTLFLIIILLTGFIYFSKYINNFNVIKKKLFINFIFIIYLLFFLFFIFFITPLDYLYTSQDSFAWWGQSIRWMFENEKIWDENSPLTQKYNVPGPHLYQFIVLKIFGFSELNTLLAINFLIFYIFSLCLYLLNIKIFDYLIIYPLILCALPLFEYHYADIMVDGLLSAFITLYLIIFFKLINYNKNYKLFFLVSCILVLVKTIGLLIVIIFSLTFFFKSLIDFKKKKKYFLSLFLSALPLTFSLLIYFTWSNYLFDINANRASRIDFYYLLSESSVIKLLSIIDGFKNWLIESNFLLIKIHEFSFISTHIIFNVFTIFIFFQFFKFKNVLKYIYDKCFYNYIFTSFSYFVSVVLCRL